MRPPDKPCSEKFKNVYNLEDLASLTDNELDAMVKYGERYSGLSRKLLRLLDLSVDVMERKNIALHRGVPNDSVEVRQATRLWKVYVDNDFEGRIADMIETWSDEDPPAHLDLLESVGMRIGKDGTPVAKNPLEDIVGIE